MRGKAQQRGFTLIELMVTVAIMAILAAIAYPSFTDLIERNRLKGATEGLFADLQFAKAEAIKRNQDVTLTATTGTSWKYDITLPDATVLKSVKAADVRGVTLSAATNAGKTVFKPVRSTADAASFTMQRDSDTSQTMKVKVSDLGRILICSDSSAVLGYKSCP